MIRGENSEEEDEVLIRGTTPPRRESEDQIRETNLPELKMCDSWEKVDLPKTEMDIIRQGNKLAPNK